MAAAANISVVNTRPEGEREENFHQNLSRVAVKEDSLTVAVVFRQGIQSVSSDLTERNWDN